MLGLFPRVHGRSNQAFYTRALIFVHHEQHTFTLFWSTGFRIYLYTNIYNKLQRLAHSSEDKHEVELSCLPQSSQLLFADPENENNLIRHHQTTAKNCVHPNSGYKIVVGAASPYFSIYLHLERLASTLFW